MAGTRQLANSWVGVYSKVLGWQQSLLGQALDEPTVPDQLSIVGAARCEGGPGWLNPGDQVRCLSRVLHSFKYPVSQ